MGPADVAEVDLGADTATVLVQVIRPVDEPACVVTGVYAAGGPLDASIDGVAAVSGGGVLDASVGAGNAEGRADAGRGAPWAVEVGDDLSAMPVPMRVSSGTALSFVVRATGHEVLVHGPALLRPCTRSEPSSVLVVDGAVEVRTSAARAGTELFLATPGFVAVVSAAPIRVNVDGRSGRSSWEAEEGAFITTLDREWKPSGKDRGFQDRFDDLGVLLTRCGVQTASAARSARWVRALERETWSGPALPSASAPILIAREGRLARERALDCAFARAVALGCDVMCARPTGDAGLPLTCDEATARDAGPRPASCKKGGIGFVNGYLETVVRGVDEDSADGPRPPRAGR